MNKFPLIPAEVLEHNSKLIEIRRYLHENPELAFEEFQTSAYIIAFLKEIGLEVFTEVGKTGVVGLLKGTAPGPTILLRADMDALPIKETTNLAFESKNPGKHHACGHDGHVAILLIAAKLITEKYKAKIKGNIKFVFQPAEEKHGGAEKMIQDPKYPVMDIEPKVDECFGLHLTSLLEVGKILLSKGYFSAFSYGFRVKVKGIGGHGAAPHVAKDPIFVACQLIENFYAIPARNINPCNQSVITVGRIQGGEADNVIPNECEFQGTFRCFEEKDRDIFLKRIEEISKGFEMVFDVKIEVHLDQGYPAIYNDALKTSLLLHACKEVVGHENIEDAKQGLYGEDFSFFAKKAPSAFFLLGAAIDNSFLMHHNSNFNFNEEALAIGVAVWLKLIETRLISE